MSDSERTTTPQADPATSTTERAAASAAAPAPSLSIGQRLGDRYQVLRFLGAGGMGAVYLARDERLDVEVALKVVRAGVADVLRDEVRLAQRVTHPNVCRTYDLEEADGIAFVKMEVVPGRTLAKRLASGPVPVPEALGIARQVAAALAAAHAARIVHCDLKPQNVMITPEGRAVLMDFGLARPTLLATETVAGTPGYMAPELLEGAAVDERADAYALGCLLYELLVGERVFASRSFDSMALLHREASPPDPRLRRPAVPRWLARSVLALLEKDPARRPADPVALLAERRLSGWRLAAPAAAAIAAASVALFLWRPWAHPWRPTVAPVTPVFEENSDAASFSLDGRWIAYPSDREEPGVFRIYLQRLSDGDTRPLSPAGWSVSDPRFTRDGNAILANRYNGDGELIRIDVSSGTVELLAPQAVGADDCGDAVVYLGEIAQAQALFLRDAGGQTRELVRAAIGEQLDYPRCSRDGQHILYLRGEAPREAGTGRVVWITDRAGHARRLTVEAPAGSLAWGPDGSSFLYAGGLDGASHIWEQALAGGPAHQVTFGDGAETAPEPSPDGQLLLFNVDRTTRLLTQYVDGRARRITQRQEILRAPSVTSDGTRVLAERLGPEGEPEAVAIRVVDGEAQALGPGRLPTEGADGSIYFVAPTEPDRLRAVPRGGGATRDVARLPGAIGALAPGPDGIHAAVSRGGRIASFRVSPSGIVEPDGVDGLLVPAPDGQRRALVTGEPAVLQLLPSSADGAPGQGRPLEGVCRWLDTRRLAYADRRAFHIIDVEAGTELATLPRPDPSAVLAPDGHTIYAVPPTSRVSRHLVTNFADRPWAGAAGR